MTNTPEEIKKLILQARSFTPVNLTAQSGATINVQLGYGSVRATALTPVAGNAIAFQTDQGNWYVIGESSNNIAENNGESRRQISYRVVRPKPDPLYPVKTIFTIRDSEKLIFYLGGDRQSKEITQIRRGTTVTQFAYVKNFGKNKFYSFIIYKNAPSNDFSVVVNRNGFSPELNQEIITDDWSKNAYRGLYLDSIYMYPGDYPNKDKFDYQDGEESRKVIFKDSEVTVDNTRLISKTNVNYPDGTLFREDLELEISSLDSEGEIVKTKITSNTDVTFNTHYPFLRIYYEFFESENLHRYGMWGVWLGFSQTAWNYTREREIEYTAIFNNGLYTITTVDTRTLSAEYYRGLVGYDETNNMWLLYSAVPDSSNDFDLVFEVTDSLIVPVIPYEPVPLPPDNPSTATRTHTISRQSDLKTEPVFDDPLRTSFNERLTFNFEGIQFNNYLFKTYYPEYTRLLSKQSIENALRDGDFDASEPGLVNRRSTSITWDEDFINFESTTISEFDERGLPDGNNFWFTTLKNKTAVAYIRPAYVPTRDDVVYTVEENNTILSGTQTEIVQDFIGQITTTEAYIEEIATNSTEAFRNGQRRYKKIPMFLKKEEIRNIIKVKYGDIEIDVNTGEFGLLNIGYNSTININVNPDLENGDTFTIVYTNEALKYLVNINGEDFTGAGFSGDFVLAWDITRDNKIFPYIVQGSCLHHYDPNIFRLTITCTVEKIKKNTPSSFPRRFIVNNGSIFSYLLRMNTNVYGQLYYNIVQGTQPLLGVLLEGYNTNNFRYFSDILSREILPYIPLSQSVQGLSQYYIPMYKPYCGYIDFEPLHATDNIIKNKIFSVVKTEKNKAWVEQWDIKDNGDVKYNKVFQVDYVPLKKPNEENNEQLIVFAHSYYPT